MKTTLVIMAAGIGSRFGEGIKQLEPVGIHGEIIMDYSVYDAIEAGFNKVIFIIRKEIEKEFIEVVGNRMEEICKEKGVEIYYAYQSLEDLPEGISVPKGRTKPWGTGQAVLACRDLIQEPFAVINADDYYGKNAFKAIYDFLQNYSTERPNDFCVAGFLLKNTLSENGGVTRGICCVDENLNLLDVMETPDIEKENDKVFANGEEVEGNTYVSMNMWGLTPEFVKLLENGFVDFFAKMKEEEGLTAEFLLPVFIGRLLRKGQINVKVLETKDKWFGVTYKEDKETVVESFRELIAKGVYKENLFS